MPVTDAINFDDLRLRAKRYLPKIAFDFIEGGVDGEEGIARNEVAIPRHRLVPKYLVDTSTLDASVTLFGRTYSQPYGIAPTGGISLFRPGGDEMLARAAKAANIPFILSGMGTATIETLGEIAPDHTWFQLYLARDRKISADMIARADKAGFAALVVTVDIPGVAKRERNLRNGFAVAKPMSPSLRAKAETLLHPSWLAAYMTGPGLTASQWEKYAPPEARGPNILSFIATQMPTPVTLEDIVWIRKVWPRALVVKGVMHPADAVRLAGLGVDGLMISNHGGRQLDRAPSPIEVLPAIRDAVGDKVSLMFDSGIRRGADIVTALALGAKFCFVGRWTLYGVSAGGQAGASHAVTMVNNEIAAVMAQLGTPNIPSIGPDFLMWDNDYRANRRP
jgi:(S)-mandelate dehydrogenase